LPLNDAARVFPYLHTGALNLFLNHLCPFFSQTQNL
jgi:hypothetical protein